MRKVTFVNPRRRKEPVENKECTSIEEPVDFTEPEQKPTEKEKIVWSKAQMTKGSELKPVVVLNVNIAEVTKESTPADVKDKDVLTYDGSVDESDDDWELPFKLTVPKLLKEAKSVFEKKPRNNGDIKMIIYGVEDEIQFMKSGTDCMKKKKYHEAIGYFQMVSAKNKEIRFTAGVNKSFCYQKLECHEFSLREVLMAVCLSPDHPMSYERMASVFTSVNKYVDAEYCLKKSLNLMSIYPDTTDKSRCVEVKKKLLENRIEALIYDGNYSHLASGAAVMYDSIEDARSALTNCLVFRSQHLNSEHNLNRMIETSEKQVKKAIRGLKTYRKEVRRRELLLNYS